MGDKPERNPSKASKRHHGRNQRKLLSRFSLFFFPPLSFHIVAAFREARDVSSNKMIYEMGSKSRVTQLSLQKKF